MIRSGTASSSALDASVLEDPGDRPSCRFLATLDEEEPIRRNEVLVNLGIVRRPKDPDTTRVRPVGVEHIERAKHAMFSV
jgi:hypothetical protein